MLLLLALHFCGRAGLELIGRYVGVPLLVRCVTLDRVDDGGSLLHEVAADGLVGHLLLDALVGEWLGDVVYQRGDLESYARRGIRLRPFSQLAEGVQDSVLVVSELRRLLLAQVLKLW